MSKAPYRNDFGDNDDLPPPYSAEDEPSSRAANEATRFSSHLGNLRQQIDLEQASRSLLRDQIDDQILALIIPHLEEILSSIATIHPAPKLVVATFVPAEAVTDWTPVEDDGYPCGEVHKTVRVKRFSKGAGGSKESPEPTAEQSAGREFDGWGRWNEENDSRSAAKSETQLWWSNENMARRLAKYLQPRGKQSIQVEKSASSVSKEGKQAQSSGVRNILGKITSTFPEPLVSGNTPMASSSTQGNPDVTLTVGAEEVTFRKENDFGLWESMTGWGIVARVRLGQR
jgi:hypothetical protein